MKIALCISGETREYNKYHGPDTLITLLLDLGHTVDIFAHTWEHCERPVPLLYPIKKLIIDNQQELIGIWSASSPDHYTWREGPDGPPASLEVTCEKIGQHVSGLRSLALPETLDYDVFVRWRWDLEVQIQWLNQQRDWIDVLYNPWIEWIGSNNNDSFCITENGGWIARYNWSIQDTHFMLNKIAHTHVKTKTWQSLIANVWGQFGKCSYHTLWNQIILRELEANFGCQLPQLAGFDSQERAREKAKTGKGPT